MFRAVCCAYFKHHNFYYGQCMKHRGTGVLLGEWGWELRMHHVYPMDIRHTPAMLLDPRRFQLLCKWCMEEEMERKGTGDLDFHDYRPRDFRWYMTCCMLNYASEFLKAKKKKPGMRLWTPPSFLDQLIRRRVAVNVSVSSSEPP
jgi:hypothetical protein